MKPGVAYVLAVLVVLSALLAYAFVWYYRGDAWTAFAFATNDPVAWTAAGATPDTARLRFRKAVFTVTVNGAPHAQDVTPVLNAMARAHTAGDGNNGTLKLDDYLNPFSFVIAGVNDAQTVPASNTPAWRAATATLKGQYRTL